MGGYIFSLFSNIFIFQLSKNDETCGRRPTCAFTHRKQVLSFFEQRLRTRLSGHFDLYIVILFAQHHLLCVRSIVCVEGRTGRDKSHTWAIFFSILFLGSSPHDFSTIIINILDYGCNNNSGM